jgi:hypothetical protein
VLLTCCWLYGCSFLIATPIYAWYALPFVVLVIMAGRLEWLAVWVALYVAFIFDQETFIQTLAFGAALGVVVLAGYGRRRRTGRRLAEVPTHNAENFTPVGASASGPGVNSGLRAPLG